MCPLCRGPVYASQLESIEECSSEKVVDFALNVGLPSTWLDCSLVTASKNGLSGCWIERLD